MKNPPRAAQNVPVYRDGAFLLYCPWRTVMAKGFSLEIDPWVYRAKFQEDGGWTEEYVEKPHLSPE